MNDPVAYFTSNKAIKGKENITASLEGVTYNFATSVNKDAFLKSPKKFEPEYGGWCACAMGSAEEKGEIDPETFKILNGKLYLFYNSFLKAQKVIINHFKMMFDASVKNNKKGVRYLTYKEYKELKKSEELYKMKVISL